MSLRRGLLPTLEASIEKKKVAFFADDYLQKKNAKRDKHFAEPTTTTGFMPHFTMPGI